MSFNFPVLRMSQTPEVAARFVALPLGVEGLMRPTGGQVHFQFSRRPENVRRVVRRFQTRKEAGGSPDAEARDYSMRRGDGLAGSRLVTGTAERPSLTGRMGANKFQPRMDTN